MRIEIPSQVEWILSRLKNHGYEAFAVGGCVRDTLLGKIPEDWDITTSAKPEQVKKVFGKTVDTGILHGTVTVLKEGTGYEVTTYRIDGEYEDGRHPKEVSFTSELKEDLRRRDFTINAMAYSHETGIVDIFGGMEDLERHIIRCVGDPMERFTEDALRILRGIRFSAQLGFAIEEKTFEALSVIAPNLEQISKERIQVEITKTLLSAHPDQILLTKETGMSPYISQTFPEIFTGKTDKVAAAAGLPRDKALRYAALLFPVGEKRTVMILKELKMDNYTIDRVKILVRFLQEPLQADAYFVRKLMSDMSDELFDALLILKETLFKEMVESVKAVRKLGGIIRENGDCIRLKDVAVNGRDLMEAGMKPGKRLGETLDQLLCLVLKHPEYNSKEKLLAVVGKEEL